MAENLRGHVEGRACEGHACLLGKDLSKSEVAYLNPALFEHDVGRLEIPVDKLGLNNRSKPSDDLVEIFESFFLFEPFLVFDVVAEIPTIAVLHYQVVVVVGFQYIVKTGDVLAVEVLQRSDLLVQVCNLIG